MRNFILLMAVLGLTGCDNPKNEVLPNDIKGNEDKLKSIVEKLSDEDKELLVRRIMADTFAKGFGKEPIIKPGTTVGKAIEEQKKFENDRSVQENEEQALREQIQKETEILQKQFDENLTVSLISKKLAEADYSQYISIKIAFKNKSVKEIRGIKGIAIFSDIFDDPISKVNLSLDEAIKPDATYVFDGSVDYNRYNADDKKLAFTDDEKIVFKFQPQVILFTDGTKLSISKDLEK